MLETDRQMDRQTDQPDRPARPETDRPDQTRPDRPDQTRPDQSRPTVCQNRPSVRQRVADSWFGLV